MWHYRRQMNPRTNCFVIPASARLMPFKECDCVKDDEEYNMLSESRTTGISSTHSEAEDDASIIQNEFKVRMAVTKEMKMSKRRWEIDSIKGECRQSETVDAVENQDECEAGWNAFLCEVVLSVLFPYLDKEALAASRLVCKRWHNEATPFFRKKAFAFLHCVGDIGIQQFIHRFMQVQLQCNCNDLFPYENFDIVHINMKSKKSKQLFIKFGSKMKSLRMNCMNHSYPPSKNDGDFQLKDLEKILGEWCLNLETLKLSMPFGIVEKEVFKPLKNSSALSLSRLKSLTITATMNDYPLKREFAESLLKCMPNLKHLCFHFGDDGAFDQVICSLITLCMNGYGCPENLNAIELGHEFGNIFYDSHLSAFLGMNLMSLTSLSIGCLGVDISRVSMKNLLHCLSTTLKVLRIEKYDMLRTKSIVIEFPFMENLMVLDISDRYIRLKSDNFLNNLPKLKICKLGSFIPSQEPTERYWNEIFSTNYALDETPKYVLKELHLRGALRNSETLAKILKYFPELKFMSLKPMNECRQKLFEYLSKSDLEELHLNFPRIERQSLISMLTAIPLTMERNSMSMAETGGIGDLKKLQKLVIRTDSKCNESHEVPFLNGLAFAKELTSLEIQNFDITENDVLKLASQLSLVSLKLSSCVLISDSVDTLYRSISSTNPYLHFDMTND